MEEIHKALNARRLHIEENIDMISKGIKLPVGTIRKRPNGNFIKTANGWKYHSSAGSRASAAPTTIQGLQAGDIRNVNVIPSGKSLIPKKHQGKLLKIDQVYHSVAGTTEVKFHIGDDGYGMEISEFKRMIAKPKTSSTKVSDPTKTIKTTEVNESIKAKYDSLLGKTVEAFGSGRSVDTVLDFGEKILLHRKHGIQIPANPMGYHEAQGTYFAVKRNGQTVILQPGFGEKALKSLAKPKATSNLPTKKELIQKLRQADLSIGKLKHELYTVAGRERAVVLRQKIKEANKEFKKMEKQMANKQYT